VPGPILQHPAYVIPDREALSLAAPGECLGSEDPSHERGDLAGAFALLAKMSQDFALSMDIATTLERALAMIAAQLDAEAGSPACTCRSAKASSATAFATTCVNACSTSRRIRTSRERWTRSRDS
jgi:hypothetical protein